MKHLLYPMWAEFSRWKNIIKNNNEVIIKPFELANEMIIFNGKYTIEQKEKEFRRILEHFLNNNVISFTDENNVKITDICKEIRYLGGHQNIPEDQFQFDTIEIGVEDDFYLHTVENEIIVHLNINRNTFREMKKFNL